MLRIFTGKHNCWCLINKIAGLKACKETPTHLFCRTTPVAASVKWWNSTDIYSTRYLLTFFLTDWRKMRRKNNRNIFDLLKCTAMDILMSNLAWCKSGTRTPWPQDPGFRDPPTPPLPKFKSGTRDRPKV